MSKNIKKILCCCISGLGSSFLVEMNVKKVLEKLGLSHIQVEHSGISDVMPGSADLFICSSDVADEVANSGPVVSVMNLMSEEEIEEKLKSYLAASDA